MEESNPPDSRITAFILSSFYLNKVISKNKVSKSVSPAKVSFVEEDSAVLVRQAHTEDSPEGRATGMGLG